MDIVLHDILHSSRAYIDDILIYILSWEDHCDHLILVLQKFCDARLTLKACVGSCFMYLHGLSYGKCPM